MTVGRNPPSDERLVERRQYMTSIPIIAGGRRKESFSIIFGAFLPFPNMRNGMKRSRAVIRAMMAMDTHT
jgi:hypothetical protein